MVSDVILMVSDVILMLSDVILMVSGVILPINRHSFICRWHLLLRQLLVS
jgi:hypothetical protein